jgi:hypothetical protein
VATPLVQGRLRNEPLTFDVCTECAHCGQIIRFRMRHDLSYEIEQTDCAPLFFVPLVDLPRLEAPSIIDDF